MNEANTSKGESLGGVEELQQVGSQLRQEDGLRERVKRRGKVREREQQLRRHFICLSIHTHTHCYYTIYFIHKMCINMFLGKIWSH